MNIIIHNNYFQYKDDIIPYSSIVRINRYSRKSKAFVNPLDKSTLFEHKELTIYIIDGKSIQISPLNINNLHMQVKDMKEINEFKKNEAKLYNKIIENFKSR